MLTIIDRWQLKDWFLKKIEGTKSHNLLWKYSVVFLS